MISAFKIVPSALIASLMLLPVAAPVTAPGTALAQQPPKSAQQTSTILQDAAYQDCLAAVRKNPEDGFGQAQLWEATGGGLPAQHCAALALVELKHYGDAADRLEKLLPLTEKQAPHLTVAILDQAANAWLLAEQPERSRQLLDIALKAAPDTPDLLIDRALAFAAMNDYPSARRDLDVALSADPTREDALALRASARRQTGDMTGALEDAETALAIAPRLPEALLERGILRLNKGDKKGAREDLIQVRLLAPDTPAAVAAGQYIEQMDVRQDPQ